MVAGGALGGGGGGAANGGAGGGGGGAKGRAGGGGENGADIDMSEVVKVKNLLDKMGININQIDISQINNLGHKYDGKDSLQPSLCHDSINDRYGVGKHFVRGTRDVGFAIISEAENIIDGVLGGLPLVPNVANGVGGGLKALLCAIEDGFSDFGSDFDSATDIAKHGLVNFFKLQGPHPILGIPLGIAGIAGEAGKAAVSIAGDAVSGVENAVGQLLSARNVMFPIIINRCSRFKKIKLKA
ncbi:uncharacterized protein TNCT_249692 [Trichonephila clavata]|uniref:Uncharacterized protein n=1 Tax=Trichonephila clavata TaxID=2740835 RepID=A0A8X6FKA0_TRICU|nr:uncharacterized protein TNCT_249692 [Trichonephila clavata]